MSNCLAFDSRIFSKETQFVRLAYLTAHAPYGRVESFVLKEILALQKRGHTIWVIPRNPPKFVLHRDYFEAVAEHTIRTGLFSFAILVQNVRILFTSPLAYFKALRMLFHSRNLSVLAKNWLVFPKAIWVASLLKTKQIEHVHAHWGSTPSTVALIASQIAGVPWSLTIHRYGLLENNLLREKVAYARFTRVISEKSRQMLLEIVGINWADKIRVIHVGVEIPAGLPPQTESRGKITVAVPANFVEVKGHIYLIQAAARLVRAGVSGWHMILWGDGPLREFIQKEIERLRLREYFDLPGAVPHSEILTAYRRGLVQIVALPSIVTDDGIFEGIPLSLVEALAHRIPVVATRTGSIPELLEGGAGLLVPEKSPEALQEAFTRLFRDEALRKNLAEIGFQKVEEQFNLERIARQLESLFNKNALSNQSN